MNTKAATQALRKLGFTDKAETVAVLESFGVSHDEEEVAALLREVFFPAGTVSDAHYESYAFLSGLHFGDDSFHVHFATRQVISDLGTLLPWEKYTNDENWRPVRPSTLRK